MSDREFFIVATSFAAPFCSDTSQKFIAAATPEAALEKFAAEYTHPCGLYAALCYVDANAEAKHEPPLAKWLSNHEQAKMAMTKGKGSYTYRGDGPGDFTVDGERHAVENPRNGSVVRP